jgi:hypothetical protein
MQTARGYEPLHKREYQHRQLEAIDSRQPGSYRPGEIDDLEPDSWLMNAVVFGMLMFIGWHMI